jgi:hypothetical protein
MFGRNIDFWAVGLIAVVMAMFSWTSSVRIDPAITPVEFQTAVNADPCPVQEVLSRISYILNQ